MANTIKIKRGSGTPTTSNLAAYELAYDYTNDKLYIHDPTNSAGNEIVEITAASVTTGTVVDGGTALATGDQIYDHVTSRISGLVDTSGSPVANEYARFTDNNTIEGRSYSAVRNDLGLNIGSDVQAYDTLLQDIADLSLSNPTQDGYVLAYNDTSSTLELVEQSGGAVSAVANGANNRIATFSSSDALNGESNLTFDGDFKVTGTLSTLETVNFDQASGDTVVRISGTGNQRLEFKDSATGANSWIGIPSWDDDAVYIFGPTSTGNEQAWKYESSIHRFNTGSSEQLAIYSNGAIDMSGYSVADRHLEIGSNRQVNGYAYIDLIGDTTYTDFGARFIRENGGPNTGTAIEHRGTGVLSLNAKDAGSVRFYTSNTERVRVDSSGNVSIGNFAPTYKLDVNGGIRNYANGSAVFRTESTAAGYGAYNKLITTTNTYDVYALNGDFKIDENGVATRFVIKDTTGNVGIGETNPSALLTIKNTGSGGTTTLKLEDNAREMYLGRDSIKVTTLDGSTAATMYINYPGGNCIFGGTITTGGQLAINDTNAILYRNSNDLELKTYSGYDINLMPAGNVGVGTNSPQTKLEVKTAIDSINTILSAPLATIGNTTAYLNYQDLEFRNNYSSTTGTAKVRLRHHSNLYVNSGSQFSIATSTTGGTITEALRVDHSQNVGIGTSSPGTKLEVNGGIKISSDNQKLTIGANSDLELYAHDPAGDSRINVNNNPLLITYNGVDRFRMNSTALIINEGGGDYNFKVEGDNDASLFFVDAGTDRVGIGTSSPSFKLKVNVDDATYTNLNTIAGFQSKRGADSENEVGIAINSSGDGLLGSISSNLSWSASTASKGNTGRSSSEILLNNLGNDESTFTFRGQAYNSTSFVSYMLLDAGQNLHVDGDVVAYSTSVSDKRLKDNIKTIDNALDKVMALRGVEFDWNATSRSGQHDIGLIAQEVEEIIPEIVREKKLQTGEFTDNEKTFKTIDYDKMVGVLVEAIKEQQQQINELKEKLNG